MAYVADGKQRCESTRETNRRLAEEKLNVRLAQIAQGNFDLLKKHAPAFGEWSEKYLDTVQHANTRRRYASSRANLISFFGESAKLSHVSVGRIEEFKRARREAGIKAATANRDLRFLAQILKQAERERYIRRSPFDLAKCFLNESKERRRPKILTDEEQGRLLAVASPRIRTLTVLGVETGMRTGEMQNLRWEDVDFLQGRIKVEKSKTQAGIRVLGMTAFCKSELLRWRNLVGEESEWVFPSFSNRRHKLQGGRKAWASALKKAGIAFFPMYYLRHAFATRMTAEGVSPITIAQTLGHNSTQIVPRYAQVLDQNRIDAIKRLDLRRQASIAREVEPQTPLLTVPANSIRQPSQRAGLTSVRDSALLRKGRPSAVGFTESV